MGTMAGNIRITPDTMRQRANEYRTEASKVGDTISTMDRLLSTLESEWEGEASKSYNSRYQSELRPSFQKAREMIEEIAAALDKTAQTLEDTDRQIASGFRG